MKNSKGKGAAGLLILLAALVGFIYLAYLTVSQNKIKLGLDLAGGVSITYQTVDPNPSDQDMRDTIYKLQQRVGSYSDEAQVYQEGTNRINIDIPGVSDANTILEELGKPGSLQFIEPDGTVILTGDQVKSAQAGQMQDRTTGVNEFVVELSFGDEGTKKFAEATTRLVGQRIAIVYDGIMYSNPTVREPGCRGGAGTGTLRLPDHLPDLRIRHHHDPSRHRRYHSFHRYGGRCERHYLHPYP